MILPAVKVQRKKKKLSPGSNSNKAGDSVMDGQNRNHHPSSSRMSTSGIRRTEPKLRPTLDQSLHYVATSVKVPIKQTNFYDNKHDSHITEQQMNTWKI